VSDPLRVALIGYGLAGAHFHAPLIDAVPDLHLTAIVTRNPDRVATARRDHPQAAIWDTADQVWARADDIDLVVVATPNRTHIPFTRAAIAAGLAVVVDKPFTATAGAGRALVDEARDGGVVLTVFHNRRWDGDFLTVRRLMGEGALGEVYRFESRFERWRPEVGSGWRELADADEGGGMLLDLGSHLVDQALVLFGPVRDVYAELDARRQGAAVDDDSFLALTHRSGVRSHLWMGATAAQLGPRIRVMGSRAAYVKWGLDTQEDALRSGLPAAGPGWGIEPQERWGRLGTDADATAVPTEVGAYPSFYQGVADAIRHGAPPPVDPLDAVVGLGILDAARRSHEERRVVHLPLD
jgi:scyllo-inositol 2-dehydrogenase (NADP+)